MGKHGFKQSSKCALRFYEMVVVFIASHHKEVENYITGQSGFRIGAGKILVRKELGAVSFSG